jgi:hypothetical protein
VRRVEGSPAAASRPSRTQGSARAPLERHLLIGEHLLNRPHLALPPPWSLFCSRWCWRGVFEFGCFRRWTPAGEVDLTGRHVERALRPAVLWRKGSFGSDSVAGSRFAERLLTVAATCRQQGRPLLDCLVAVAEAALQGVAAPSLLPAHRGS